MVLSLERSGEESESLIIAEPEAGSMVPLRASASEKAMLIPPDVYVRSESSLGCEIAQLKSRGDIENVKLLTTTFIILFSLGLTSLSGITLYSSQ
jgi:hypothetical protein